MGSGRDPSAPRPRLSLDNHPASAWWNRTTVNPRLSQSADTRAAPSRVRSSRAILGAPRAGHAGLRDPHIRKGLAVRPEVYLYLPPPWRWPTPPSTVALQAEHGGGEYSARVVVTIAEPSGDRAGDGVETLTRALEGFRLVDQGIAAQLAGRPCDCLVGRYLSRGRLPVTLTRWSAVVDSWLVRVSATIPSRRHDDLIDEVSQAVGDLRVVAWAP
jgi:hypothetical protein